VERYLAGAAAAQRERGYLDAALASIAEELDARPKYVYWSREREIPLTVDVESL
jgi:hypothetical protein